MSEIMYTDVPMTKENRLAILKEARKILSDEKAWTSGELMEISEDGKPQYCVLGAVEQATYTLGLAKQGEGSFTGDDYENEDGINAYDLGRDLSLFDYSNRVFDRSPEDVNDALGYASAIALLDGYIAEVEAS